MEIPLDPIPPRNPENPKIPVAPPQINLSQAQKNDIPTANPTPSMLAFVDEWVKAQGGNQVPRLVPPHNEPAILLSTAERVFNRSQIHDVRPTTISTPLGKAPGVIFRYWHPETGTTELVTIKLNDANDARMLTRAIAWVRIWDYPYGEFDNKNDPSLMNQYPSFDPGACLKEYFKQAWQEGARHILERGCKIKLENGLQQLRNQVAELQEKAKVLEKAKLELNNALATEAAGLADTEQDLARAKNQNAMLRASSCRDLYVNFTWGFLAAFVVTAMVCFALWHK